LRKRFIVVAPTVELGGTDTVADSKESVCLFYKGIKHLRMRIFGPLSEENGSIFLSRRFRFVVVVAFDLQIFMRPGREKATTGEF
jgi:hypothetical protein